MSKILVVRLDQIGDVVQTLPFYEKLRIEYPSAEIHLVVTKHAEFLVKNLKEIDRVITPDNSWFYENSSFDKSELLKIFREEKYDLAHDLRGDLRNIIMLRLANVKWIFGYGCTGGKFLLDEIGDYNRDEHEWERYHSGLVMRS